MASINKTEFLQLSMWSGDDYLERLDVTSDNQAVDDFAKKISTEVTNLKSEKANVVTVNRQLEELMYIIDTLDESTASEDELRELNDEVNKLRDRVIKLGSETASKASLEYVDKQLKTKASVTALNNKADSSRVSKLEKEVSDKANKDEVDSKLNKDGDTATGLIRANSNTRYNTGQVRNIVLSTEKPTLSMMGNGDIWLKYE